MNPADEIEYLRVECRKLAALLMSEYVFVHEHMIGQVDAALEPYRGCVELSLPTVNGNDS